MIVAKIDGTNFNYFQIFDFKMIAVLRKNTEGMVNIYTFIYTGLSHDRDMKVAAGKATQPFTSLSGIFDKIIKDDFLESLSSQSEHVIN